MKNFPLNLFWTFLGVWVALILVLLAPDKCQALELPEAAASYRILLTAEVRRHWGIKGPIALMGAQIHQESAWNPDAKSKYAIGLTQFTPPTAADMERWYQEQLGNLPRYSPLWSVRAMVIYDKRIFDSLRPFGQAIQDCDRYAMMLAGYNGGPAWIKRDRRLAVSEGSDPDIWWGHVENHSNRAEWAFVENRDYPRRIIYRHQQIYHKAWGGAWVC